MYDESTYINESIAMLRTNLLLGIGLAISILWWFLRKFRATFMVALAIPISLFTAFLLMQATGRTLNMISLAGLAFAMGMVLDGAIVVLENIVRLREKGKQAEEAATLGSGQVAGALLASTATTVVIFMPIVFLQDISGQLFADLAIVIAVAVTASLIIALTVIPTAAAKWLKDVRLEDAHKDWWQKLTALIMRLTDSAKFRHAWIVGLFAGASLLTWALLPPADYLPKGNQGWVFAFILAPPGQSVETAREEFIEVLTDRLAPHLEEGAEYEIEVPVTVEFVLADVDSVGVAQNRQIRSVVHNQQRVRVASHSSHTLKVFEQFAIRQRFFTNLDDIDTTHVAGSQESADIAGDASSEGNNASAAVCARRIHLLRQGFDQGEALVLLAAGHLDNGRIQPFEPRLQARALMLPRPVVGDQEEATVSDERP